MVRRLVAPAAVGVALLATSAWLDDPRVGYLAVAALATGMTFVTLRARTASRLSLGLAALALSLCCVFAARAQIRLERFSSAPARVGNEEAAERRVALRQQVEAELAELRTAARTAWSVPTDARAAVAALERSVGDVEHRALLVIRRDTLVVWAGTLHAGVSQLTAPSGIVASPFGLTLYVVADSGRVRGIATSLLYSASPADRLSKGLSQRMPSDEVTEGFTFAPPSETPTADDLVYTDQGRTLFLARPIVPSMEEVRLRMLERARVRVALGLLLALVAFLIAAARRGGGAITIVGGTLVVVACIAIIPLSEFSSRSRLFDPSVYFFQPGRAFTSNSAALAITSATVLLLVLLVVRRMGRHVPREVAVAIAAATIVAGPFGVRALSQGIQPPGAGTSAGLWLIWNIPLCLATTALLVLANWAGRRVLGEIRGAPIMAGPTIAAIAAVLAPILWEAPGQWPGWYALLWALAVAALVLARPSRRSLRACAMVAALASTTVVWASAARGRVALAEQDVRGLSGPDSNAVGLAARLVATMEGEDLPRTPQALLERYVTSNLAAAGYPVALMSWKGSQPVAAFGSGPFDVAFDTVGFAAQRAELEQRPVTTTTRAGVYGVHVVAFPMRGGSGTIIVAPRTRLIGIDPYVRWYGLANTQSVEPPYSVQLFSNPLEPRTEIQWWREANGLHGDWPVLGPGGPARAHVEVDLRGLDTLVPRGGLLVIIDLFVVSLVWLLAAIGDGRIGRWARLRRRQIQSYRARLSIALFLFFLVPAGAFAVWSWTQLVDDALTARRLLVTETMRAFSGDPARPDSLYREARRLDTKLLLYRSGQLYAASDSLFADLSPMGTLLRPGVALALRIGQEASATKSEPLDGAEGMLGYRTLPGYSGQFVLAAPARIDDLLIDRRRRDLGVLVLFATALGAVAALWLSGIAARQLAHPIAALREAARAVARGESDVRLNARAVREFLPVFSAFRAMASDLGESRAALVEAQRRTDAVLRTVASGVIAVDETGRVILANPRADVLLGSVAMAGQPMHELAAKTVATRLAGFLQSNQESDGFELDRDGCTLRGQLTRLARGGAVLTIDDVTELARAQRVLAWGEMARQVAHEIKNPLTPIRLGVQHLLRARGRADFDTILEQNVSRILDEIDRLDEIARAFSRYGGAPAERVAAEPTDVASIVRDVVSLETLGEGNIDWSCRVIGDVSTAFARADELREVLLNVFENARHAGASIVGATVCQVDAHGGMRHVRVEVVDNGSGIPSNILPKIFEPHFSTRTSGSGLGLAISRRLVDSWGGAMDIESAPNQGTTVRIDLRVS